jgi:hypothetical protein
MKFQKLVALVPELTAAQNEQYDLESAEYRWPERGDIALSGEGTWFECSRNSDSTSQRRICIRPRLTPQPNWITPDRRFVNEHPDYPCECSQDGAVWHAGELAAVTKHLKKKFVMVEADGESSVWEFCRVVSPEYKTPNGTKFKWVAATPSDVGRRCRFCHLLSLSGYSYGVIETYDNGQYQIYSKEFDFCWRETCEVERQW